MRLFRQPQPPQAVSQHQRQSALQVSYAVLPLSPGDVWGLLPVLLGEAKSTRARLGQIHNCVRSPSSVRASSGCCLARGSSAPSISCSFQEIFYFPGFTAGQPTLLPPPPCSILGFSPAPLPVAVLFFHSTGRTIISFNLILGAVSPTMCLLQGASGCSIPAPGRAAQARRTLPTFPLPPSTARSCPRTILSHAHREQVPKCRRQEDNTNPDGALLRAGSRDEFPCSRAGRHGLTP